MNESPAVNEYTGHMHKITFLWPIILVITGLFLNYYQFYTGYLGLFFTVIGVVLMLLNFLTYISTYIKVTDRGVLFHSGILIVDSVEIPLSKIESVDIRQNILGSILNYGTIIISGTGGTQRVIKLLAGPLTCRRHIEQSWHR